MSVTPPIALPEYVPRLAALPDADALAEYLSIKDSTRTPELDAALTAACDDMADYELGRLSYDLMRADGADPPDSVPGPVARAILMRAAAIYRRRNSINGFDGFQDLGTVPVRASDPDIERSVDHWRAWCFG